MLRAEIEILFDPSLTWVLLTLNSPNMQILTFPMSLRCEKKQCPELRNKFYFQELNIYMYDTLIISLHRF